MILAENWPKTAKILVRYDDPLNNFFPIASDIDECQSSPCRHGTCMDYPARYECVCPAEWKGVHCDSKTTTGPLLTLALATFKKALIPIPWLVIPDPGAMIPDPTLLIPNPT